MMISEHQQSVSTFLRYDFVNGPSQGLFNSQPRTSRVGMMGNPQLEDSNLSNQEKIYEKHS